MSAKKIIKSLAIAIGVFCTIIVIVLGSYVAYMLYQQSKSPQGIAPAGPILDEIVVEGVDMRALGASIVKGCQTNDKSCEVNAVYRYVVENYQYYLDPREDFIQGVEDTQKVEGGDCEDLTILMNSILENIGVQTKVVVTSDHAYTLACGVNLPTLKRYAAESLLKEFARGRTHNTTVVGHDVLETQEGSSSVVLLPGTSIYYGGDGSMPEDASAVDLSYTVKASEPVDIHVLGSPADIERLKKNQTRIEFERCFVPSVREFSGECTGLNQTGIVLIHNPGSKDAAVDQHTTGIVRFPMEKTEKQVDEEMKSYAIGNETCVVLDATAGRNGYPGLESNIIGRRIAYDVGNRTAVELS